MNTERLLEVAEVLRRELEKDHRVYELFATLAEHLKEDRLDGAEASKAKIMDLLATAPSNDFSPSRRAILREVGGEKLVGRGLADRLKAVLEDYRLSPGEASKVVAEASKEVLAFNSTLNNLSSSSSRLGLKPYGLPAGTCEVGVLYPKPTVIGDLESLVKEGGALDQALRALIETGGEQGSPRIAQISSSDVALYFSVAVGAGLAIAKCIKEVLEIVQKKLDIEKIRLEIEEKRLGAEMAKRLREQESEVEEKGIDQAAEAVVATYEGADTGRKNELRAASKLAVKFMLAQIRRGVVFEVTASTVTSMGVAIDEPLKKDKLGTEARQLKETQSLGGCMRELAARRDQLAIAEAAEDRRPDLEA